MSTKVLVSKDELLAQIGDQIKEEFEKRAKDIGQNLTVVNINWTADGIELEVEDAK